jgi:hypothetical protein
MGLWVSGPRAAILARGVTGFTGVGQIGDALKVRSRLAAVSVYPTLDLVGNDGDGSGNQDER